MRLKILAGMALSVMAAVQSIAYADLTMTPLVRVDGTFAHDTASAYVTAGQVVTIDIYAVVTQTGTGSVGFQAACGSLVANTSATLKGSLAPAGSTPGYVCVDPFTNARYLGYAMDTNSDGFIDRLGALNGWVTSAYVYGRAGSMQTVTSGMGILWGSVTFTVDPNAAADSSTTVSFVPQYNSTGGPVITGASWKENGLGKMPSNSTYSGSSVTLSLYTGVVWDATGHWRITGQCMAMSMPIMAA